MTDLISKFKKELLASAEDYLMTRAERRELKDILKGDSYTEHERQLMWSEVRNVAREMAIEANASDIVGWMYECGKILNPIRATKGDIESYFSPGTACREAICSRIRFAVKEIRICVFTISDDEITEELLAAHRNRKKIRIITDDDKSEDLGSDIDRMRSSGIEILMDNSPVHMHHKFALFDQEYLLTGSYNWTRSAAEHNYENVMLLNDPKAFSAYAGEFERLWKKLNKKNKR